MFALNGQPRPREFAAARMNTRAWLPALHNAPESSAHLPTFYRPSYPPITAPALVLVGAMMLRSVTKIDWADHGETGPTFLLLPGIPLSYSIADDLALGFIRCPLVKLLAGRARDVVVLRCRSLG